MWTLTLSFLKLALVPLIICQFLLVPICFAEHPDGRLILTPLIKNGDIAKAREASRVRHLPGDGGIKSYAAYLTVNETFNSNLYFWFFPNEKLNAPLLLWLQGGPGGSSLAGLFLENGPFFVNTMNTLEQRSYTWTKMYSVLYIDNPVGAGFSFTDNDRAYARSEEDVSRDLCKALLQFFVVFSEYKDSDFYLVGESYAGKYIPTLAYQIYTTKNSPIKLKGIAIGNGFTDPVNQDNYGPYLQKLSLIDKRQEEKFKKIYKEIVDLVKRREYEKAFKVYSFELHLFGNFTGSNNEYNFLLTEEPDNKQFVQYLNRSETREAIHIGIQPFYYIN